MKDFLVVFGHFLGNNGGIYYLVLNSILKKNFFLVWVGREFSRVQGKKLVFVSNSDFNQYWKVIRNVLLTKVAFANCKFYKSNIAVLACTGITLQIDKVANFILLFHFCKISLETPVNI